ncbi:MAG: 30S ribosomal protein S5, partial [Paracoccaceae bacterium]
MAERDNRREGRGNDRRDTRPEETPEFADRLVANNLVSQNVKGGKRVGVA